MSCSTVCSLSDEAIVNIKDALPLIKTADEAERYRKHVNKIILLLHKCMDKQKNSAAAAADAALNRQENLLKLQGNFIILKFYREELKTIKANAVKIGAGISPLPPPQRTKNLIWQDVKSVFKNRVKTGTIINKAGYKDPKIFFDKAQKIFKNKINACLKEGILKVNVVFSAEFILPSTGKLEIKTFNTRNFVIDNSTDINAWYSENVKEKILRKLEEFQERDSGWSLFQIMHLNVNINHYSPIRASGYINLPPDVKRKQAIINIKNDDDYCFLWAVVSALFPANKNADRKSSYPHFENVLKYDGMDFPIRMKI